MGKLAQGKSVAHPSRCRSPGQNRGDRSTTRSITREYRTSVSTTSVRDVIVAHESPEEGAPRLAGERGEGGEVEVGRVLRLCP